MISSERNDSATVLFSSHIEPAVTYIFFLKCGSKLNKKHTPGSPTAVFDHHKRSLHFLWCLNLVPAGFNYFSLIPAGFNYFSLIPAGFNLKI